jgi:hypothetical protein
MGVEKVVVILSDIIIFMCEVPGTQVLPRLHVVLLTVNFHSGPKRF